MRTEQTTLGTRIRQYREAKGLTQVELATAVGISRQHLGNIEGDSKLPGWEVACLLSKSLNLPLEDMSVCTPT